MAFSFDTIRQGQNIGMLPDPLERLRQSPEFEMFSPQEKKDLIKDALKGRYEADAARAAYEGLNRPYYPLPDIEAFREREARRAQELGKESLKEGFKYSMLASIPKTIAQSFANISAMNLQGGQNVTDTFSRTLASYPRSQFNTPNIQYQKYFS